MLGLTGLGKTHLSLAIGNIVVRRGYSTTFVNFCTAIDLIEAEHFGRQKGNTLQDLLNVDFLILDDVGSEFKTEFTESTLYNLINSRITAMKPTIVSTNLTKEQFELRYNTRIVSRVMFNYHLIPFCGEDVRQLIKLKNDNKSK
jgi:DNA replication protein DnaC